MKVVLNCDLNIQFSNEDFEKTINLSKGDKLTIWRHYHHSVTEIVNNLAKSKLLVENLTLSKDLAQVMTVSKIRE
jgi:hypothetical protein